MPSRVFCWRKLVVSIVAALTVAASISSAQPARPSDKHLLIRVTTEPADVQFLYDLGLDVWDVEEGGKAVAVRVSKAELIDLQDMGFESSILDPDVYATISAAASTADAEAAPWASYHTLNGANRMMSELAEAYPDRVALHVIGESFEGRSIYALHISNDLTESNGNRPAFFVVGCHHAREWISVEVPLYLAEQLASGYSINPRVRRLLDAGDVWIVPVLNPDGFQFTHEADRLWRLNRRAFDTGVGVDLNRNYSYEWGRNSGSSGSAGTETYRGMAPFSEPETQAVRSMFDAHRFIGAVSFHSYGQVVLVPWGYTFAPPPDAPDMQNLASEMAGEMNMHHDDPFHDYASGQWATALYVASGVFEDWVYGEYGVVASLVELRPKAAPYFLLPKDQILQTCREGYAAAMHMIERVFGITQGPRGDFDASAILDLADAGTVIPCLAGPDDLPPGFPIGCPGADFNRDGRVELRDFAAFQNRFGHGPGSWPTEPHDTGDIE